MCAYVHITQRILCRINGFHCIYTVPHPACEKEKRDREKECVLETPWILETRIDLVRLMNIDEPFPYLPDRTSTFITRQRSSSFLPLISFLKLIFLSHYATQSNFFQFYIHLVSYLFDIIIVHAQPLDVTSYSIYYFMISNCQLIIYFYA